MIIHFKYSSVYMSILNSLSFIPFLTPGNHQFVLKVCEPLHLYQYLHFLLYDVENILYHPSTVSLAVLCALDKELLSRLLGSNSYSPMYYSPPGSSVHGDSPDENAGMGCHALLQGIFPNQGSNQFSCIAGGFFTI